MRLHLAAVRDRDESVVGPAAASRNWLAAPEFQFATPRARDQKSLLPRTRMVRPFKRLIPIARLLGVQSRISIAGH